VKVWANSVERDAWVEQWCAHCYQPDEARRRITGKGDGCPVLQRADRNATPPGEFTRRKNPQLGHTYKCSEHRPRPDLADPKHVAAHDNTAPLFNLEGLQ